MLSTAAWNAFLKTLEEPPAHVVFVLATTEAHKVPATIVDRCHRFDFQPPVARADRRRAATGWRSEEGIEMPDAGDRHDRARGHRQLPRRARHARAARHLRRQRGQARDVLEILGVADAELVLDAAEALVEHDPKARAARRRSGCPTSGRDYRPVHARPRRRTCATCSSCRRSARCPDSFAVTAEHTDRLSAQAERLPRPRSCARSTCSPPRIAAVKDGSEPRIQLEMALLKAAQPQCGPVAAGADVPHRAARGAGLGRRAPAGADGARAEPAEPSPRRSSRPVVQAPRRRARRGRARAERRRRPRAVAAEEAEPVADARARARAGALARGRSRRCARRTGCGRRARRARPMRARGGPAHGRLPGRTPTSSKKKAEANRELVQRALRGLTGARADDRLRAARATARRRRAR